MGGSTDQPRIAPSRRDPTTEWRPSDVACKYVDQLLCGVSDLMVLRRHMEPICQVEASCGYDIARLFLERGCAEFSVVAFQSVVAVDPDFPGARYGLARALWLSGDSARAETELRRILQAGWDGEAGQLLSHVLRSQGQLNAAAEMMLAYAETVCGEVGDLLKSMQFIRECQRQDLAARFCEREIVGGNNSPELCAFAGNLEQELGRFDRANDYYRLAIDKGVDFNKWFVLSGLASIQRYEDREHPDIALMRRRSHDQTLSTRARAAVLYSLGKACDDVGDFQGAVTAWREANNLVRSLKPWSQYEWRQFISHRASASFKPMSRSRAHGCIPIFVVGLPRSGTTLVAELLGRHPSVQNRGELPTLAYLARRLLEVPIHQRQAGLTEATDIYLKHLLRDDAPVRYYVDKNPLNFRYLDIVVAMFPEARVVHCRRNPRDTAISIWGQLFANDEYAFSSDLDDIAMVESGCNELMSYWRSTLPISIDVVDYEDLTEDPVGTMHRLADAMKIPAFDPLACKVDERAVITSASLWQVRQPIHRRSVERWRHYQHLLPELLRLFPS